MIDLFKSSGVRDLMAIALLAGVVCVLVYNKRLAGKNTAADQDEDHVNWL